MSFATNQSQQISLFDATANLTDREDRLLEKSWAKYFAENIFPEIEEEPFSVLYSDRPSRHNTPVNLATVGRDGKAKCRPFMFCFEQDGKLWFCTNNTKDVYQDMQANPYVEVSVSSPSYAWIRLHGKAVFENNMAVKEGCMNNPIVKGQYQTADNPIFEVFYLEEPHGVIADFSGNPPYEF